MSQVQTGSTTALEEAVNNAAVAPVKAGRTLQDEIRALLPQLEAAIPKGTIEPDRFVRVILTEIRKTPRLLECTRESFLGAMMQTAQLGLEVGNTLGQAFLVPYKRECTLQIGYRGFIELGWRGGILMEAREIRENDEFVFDYGAERPLQCHRWRVGQPRGDIIGYYSTAALPDGRQKLLVMDEEEIEARRQRSKAKDDGPWRTDRAAMSRKTLIRALVPQVPMSTELSEAIKVDEATITRDRSGDLKVTYQDPDDAPAAIEARVVPSDEAQAVIDAIELIEPNAQRLACSRDVFRVFGPPAEMTPDQLAQALRIIRGWPGTKAELDGGVKAPVVGEVINPGVAQGAENASLSVIDEVLDGMPADEAAVAEAALEARFGPDYALMGEEVENWLSDWLEERSGQDNQPAHDAATGEMFPPTGSADNVHSAGGEVPDDLLANTKAHIAHWDTERCKAVLGQFGLPRTGNLESMRARLVVHLAPLRHVEDPVASELF